MKIDTVFLLPVLIVAMAITLALLPYRYAEAATTPHNLQPTPDFGSFEVLQGLPGASIAPNINDFLSRTTPTIDIINILFQIGLAVLVMISLILTIVAGYFYMTAGGNSTRIDTAKKMIGAALAGLVVGFAGWLLLNTISPQFTTEVKDLKTLLPSPKPT